MMVKVTCPNAGCDASYSVSDERLGRRVRCKRCGTRFVAGDTSTPPTQGMAPPSPASGSKSTAKPSGSSVSGSKPSDRRRADAATPPAARDQRAQPGERAAGAGGDG